MKIGFERTDDNNNMYIKSKEGKDILILEIFVDDIIFGGKEVLSKDFADKMKHEFDMSMFGEIKFFVGLQVHQLKHGIFVTQSKYQRDTLDIWSRGFQTYQHTNDNRTQAIQE